MIRLIGRHSLKAMRVEGKESKAGEERKCVTKLSASSQKATAGFPFHTGWLDTARHNHFT